MIKKAFTLAETLITIGIIGVISAIMLSAIITNYQKKVTLDKLRTTYNILNNAIEMAKTEYGTDINSWYMPDTTDAQTLSNYFAEHYMLPYLNVIQDCKNGTDCHFYGVTYQREFILSNGALIVITAFNYNNPKLQYHYRVQVNMYINGIVKNLNPARDRFTIELGGGTGGGDRNKFWPYGYGIEDNCEFHKNIDNTACNKTGNKQRCFALIMCEGWKIPKDYPW